MFNEGNNLVDITYAENVAYSIWLVVTVPNIDGSIYNITNDEPMEFKKVLELFLDSLGMKAKKELGYAPLYSMKEGIDIYAEWYKKNNHTDQVL